jgi:hypothetical protein
MNKEKSEHFRNAILLLAGIAGIVILLPTFHTWYMNYVNYLINTTPATYIKPMNTNYQDIKLTTPLKTDFNPQFDVDIKKFDFTINVSMDEYNNGNINSSIIKYSPGQYCLSQSQEGMAVLKVIENSIDGFLQYDSNTIIKIVATGSADGLPVKKNITYDGKLGDLYGVEYYRENNPYQPQYADFIYGKTRMTNEYFALLRAYDVILYLIRKYSIDKKNIKLYVKEFSNIGDYYRRCDLSITLENVFMNDYNKLGWLPKFLVDRKIKQIDLTRSTRFE